MGKIIAIVALVTIGIIASAAWFITKPSEGKEPPSTKYVAFAQCLAKKKITMYGAEWCPHCKKQKSLFGAAFKYVPYVECPDNPKVCIAKKVEGYPLWLFPNGKRLEGEQSLAKLSKESSCPLPKS